MKLWFQKSPFFGLLKRNPSAQLKKKIPKNLPKIAAAATVLQRLIRLSGRKTVSIPACFGFASLASVNNWHTHPHTGRINAAWPETRNTKKSAKDAKEAPCKLVKLSNKVWNTSLKNISFQLDHPELLETIMFEPGATCIKKMRLKYDQLHDLHHANSNVNSAFRGVMFASDFDMKIHFTWTALCLTVCIEVKFSAHFAFGCCMSWISLCKVRSSLEVGHLCSKSKDSDNVRLRTSLPKTKGTGASELAIWSGELKLGVVIPHLERIWVCQSRWHLHSHILVSYKH